MLVRVHLKFPDDRSCLYGVCFRVSCCRSLCATLATFFITSHHTKCIYCWSTSGHMLRYIMFCVLSGMWKLGGGLKTSQLQDVAAMATRTHLEMRLRTRTFTQYARKVPEFAEITQNNGHTPFKVIQGHRYWYQSKAHIQFPVSD